MADDPVSESGLKDSLVCLVEITETDRLYTAQRVMN